MVCAPITSRRPDCLRTEHERPGSRAQTQKVEHRARRDPLSGDFPRVARWYRLQPSNFVRLVTRMSLGRRWSFARLVLDGQLLDEGEHMIRLIRANPRNSHQIFTLEVDYIEESIIPGRF